MSADIATSTTFSIRRRNLLSAAVAILLVFLVAVGANGVRIGDLGVSIWIVFGILFGVAFIRQLMLERRILASPSEAAATVLLVQRSGHPRGSCIKYEFVAGDGKRYMGSGNAHRPVPRAGQTVAVIYSRDQPTQSLPRQQFWFHELHNGS